MNDNSTTPEEGHEKRGDPHAGRRTRGLIVAVALAAALATLGVVIVARAVLGNEESAETPRTTSGGEDVSEPRSATSNLGLPGLQDHPPPWHAGHERLLARLKLLELPLTRREGTAMQLTTRLSLTVNDQPMGVPAGIGTHGRRIAALHTHDAGGTIHVASPVARNYTLGQFFDVWGLRFGRGCVGPFCSDEANALQVLADGQPVTGDPRSLELRDGQQITVAFGPRQQ